MSPWLIVLIVVAVVLAFLLILTLITAAGAEKADTHNTITTDVGTVGSGKSYRAVSSVIRVYRKRSFAHRIYSFWNGYAVFDPLSRYKPVVYSTIPIFYKGKRISEELLPGHLLRTVPMEHGCIILIDEISLFLSQFEFDNPLVREQVTTFFQFCRQWLDCKCFITCQSYEKICKPVRDVLGIIYEHDGFHRWLGFMPFYKVRCIPLVTISDSCTRVTDELERYFFGFLPYWWLQKLFPALKHYDSKAYSDTYFFGFSRKPLPPDGTMKQRYCIDLSAGYDVQKDYKQNRSKYHAALFKPLPGYEEEAKK